MLVDVSHRDAAHSSPPLPRIQSVWSQHEEQGGQAGGVVGLVQLGVLDGRRQAEGLRDPAAGGLDPVDPFQRRRRADGDPEAAVGAEALLGREVVDVVLAGVDPHAAGGGRGVDQDQALLRRRRPGDLHGHAGGRLVVGQGVDVDVGVRLGLRVGAGGRVDDVRGVEVGCGPCGEGEGLGEVAEGEVLAAALDEREHGDVPEVGGAAVAEDHLVALGQGEQLGHAGPEAADHGADGRLAVAGAEVAVAGGHEGGERLGPHLRGTAAEPPVGGAQVRGEGDVRRGRCHRAATIPQTRRGLRSGYAAELERLSDVLSLFSRPTALRSSLRSLCRSRSSSPARWAMTSASPSARALSLCWTA